MEQNRQKEHYESIHNQYQQHYFDSASLSYRNEFIFDKMFQHIDLNHKKVLEICCGSGHNSLYLLKKFPNIIISGTDISQPACQAYEKIIHSQAICQDITKKWTSLSLETYDVVFVVGGLHHCITDLQTTIDNVGKLLKPNGIFLFMEPNKKYFLEPIRKLWYKFDKYFDFETEEALVHNQLLEMSKNTFKLLDITYFGGPAFFLILNSMIFRLPYQAKTKLKKPLFYLERLYNKLPFCFLFPSFIGRWQKKK